MRVAGVALAAPHALIGPEALSALLGIGEAAPDAGAPLSAGAIAAREKGGSDGGVLREVGFGFRQTPSD